MDTINPDLVWIDNICCRVRYTMDDRLKQEEYRSNNYVEKSDLYNDESEDEEEYEEQRNGTIKASLHVAQCFLGYLIGTKGATKKRIENETRTDIRIPARGQSGDVSIIGNDRKSVSKAVRRIKLIIIGARQKLSITHFLSIPMTSQVIKENCNKFKNEIMQSPWATNIHPSIFIKPEKLHITLVTMFLADDGERTIGKNLLESVQTSIIRKHFEDLKDPKITLKGVSIMNDDPIAAHVLYANMHCDLKLEELAYKLREAFDSTGFLSKNREKVKLHITLMNTAELSDEEESDNKNKKRKGFDASQILEKYKDFEFGDQIVKEIHLSQCGSTNDEGYYYPTCVVTV